MIVEQKMYCIIQIVPIPCTFWMKYCTEDRTNTFLVLNIINLYNILMAIHTGF